MPKRNEVPTQDELLHLQGQASEITDMITALGNASLDLKNTNANNSYPLRWSWCENSGAYALSMCQDGDDSIDDAAEQPQKSLAGKIVGCQGWRKLQRRAQMEVQFLDELISGKGQAKVDHLTGNNVSHLQALVEVAASAPNVTAVDYQIKNAASGAIVDVVADSGRRWIKVTARSMDGVVRLVRGQGGFGKKSIIDTAETLLDAAKLNPVDFRPPALTVYFARGVYDCVRKDLEAIGVEVVGDTHPCNFGLCDCRDPPDSDEEDNQLETLQNKPLVSKVFSCVDHGEGEMVNIDVSCMMVLASDLTNIDQNLPEELEKGPFKSMPVELMRQQELKCRVLPVLLDMLEGKRLAACHTALQAFGKIVDEIGGPEEKKRAEYWLEKMTVLQDKPSARCMGLTPSNKIKRNSSSKVVFGVGDELQLRTVSANTGFIRAALGQGVNLSVMTHAGRALSGTAKRRTND